MALVSPGTGKQEKQCDICLRCFARTEHLARHRRTHTKEKPFNCPYCPRAFQRSDVKAAHVKNCHAAPSGPAGGDATNDSSSNKRARIACDNCRKLKTRCDGQEPCARCQSSARPCRYSTASSSVSNAPSYSLSEDDGTPLIKQQDFDRFVQGGEHPPHFPLAPQRTGVPFEPLHVITSIEPFHTGLGQTAVSLQPLNHPTSISQNSLVGGGPGIPLMTTDPGLMDDFWAVPTMNTQFWFDETDFNLQPGYFDTDPMLTPPNLSKPLQTLTTLMQEYYDRGSRHPSPAENKAAKSWYSAQPNLRNHSPDVIRVFLGLFRKHVPRTFSIFKDSPHNSTKCPIHYTLAMAAAGGLFCTVPGSAEVAKVMYNDARRLMLASFNIRRTSSDPVTATEEHLIMAKTFLLLHIYGLCSGDKRSYEFVEAFQGNLAHAVQEYSEACRQSPSHHETQTESARLLEALHILDCYRVIIMTQPPSLAWHHLNELALDSPHGSELAQLHQHLAKLTNGTRVVEPSARDDLVSLASLVASLWSATYPCQNKYGSDSLIADLRSLGNTDFADLACDKWLGSQHPSIDPNVLAVYHMMCIMLHANIAVLQNFAHSSTESHARDPEKSSVASEVYEWSQDRHGEIACWHANSLIAVIEGGLTPSIASKGETANPRQASDFRRLSYEAPHVPYAIYYATLVLWCGSASDDSSASTLAQAQAHLVRGERILSLHKVHVAQLLARVLNEIK